MNEVPVKTDAANNTYSVYYMEGSEVDDGGCYCSHAMPSANHEDGSALNNMSFPGQITTVTFAYLMSLGMFTDVSEISCRLLLS